MEEERREAFFPSIFLGEGGDTRFQDLLGQIH